MMLSKFAWLVLMAVLAAGCSPEIASRVDRNWGSAQRDNTEAMIADPLGSEPGHDPANPMDGKTVESAVRTHRAKQRGAASGPPTSIINIGTVGR